MNTMSLNECNTYISYYKVCINESNNFLFDIIERFIPIIDERGERESIHRRKAEYMSWLNYLTKFLRNPTIIISNKLIIFVICENFSYQMLKLLIRHQYHSYKLFSRFDRDMLSKYERLNKINSDFVKHVLEKCEMKPDPAFIKAITLELLEIFNAMFKSDRVTTIISDETLKKSLEKNLSDICTNFNFINLFDFD